MTAALSSTTSKDWRELGACRDSPLDLWFPESSAGPDGVPEEAREMCDSCMVRAACLDHALHHERHGVWAATSERGRTRMRRALRIRLVELESVELTATVAHLADEGTPPHESQSSSA